MKNQQQLVMLMIDVCLSADFLIIFQVDNESLTNFNQSPLKKSKIANRINCLPDKTISRKTVKKGLIWKYYKAQLMKYF